MAQILICVKAAQQNESKKSSLLTPYWTIHICHTHYFLLLAHYLCDGFQLKQYRSLLQGQLPAWVQLQGPTTSYFQLCKTKKKEKERTWIIFICCSGEHPALSWRNMMALTTRKTFLFCLMIMWMNDTAICPAHVARWQPPDMPVCYTCTLVNKVPLLLVWLGAGNSLWEMVFRPATVYSALLDKYDRL